MDSTHFELLERLNAQIDIWIDQENFNEIERSLHLRPSGSKIIAEAFRHEYCTEGLDETWGKLFEKPNPSLSKVRVDTDTCLNISIYKPWARLFWAKLIRAKVQEKGSDCYFRRLDQVTAYLERHLPTTKPLDQRNNELVVLYLLEMSAAGEGPDHRSFAERARRVLKRYFNRDHDNPFLAFYDLWARYNIAIGYGHEGLHLEALREFDRIIFRSWKVCTNNDTDLSKVKPKLRKFIKDRMGDKLLYLPAILSRAGRLLKLQLAYHARDTLDRNKYWYGVFDERSEAERSIILAEAFIQMAELEKSKKEIYSVVKHFSENHKKISGWREAILSMDPSIAQKRGNLYGRLLGLMLWWHLEKLNANNSKLSLQSQFALIDLILKMYWQSARYQKEDRQGYLQQVAKYLFTLAERAEKAKNAGDDRKKQEFISEALRLYEIEKSRLLKDEEPEPTCPCKKLGIDLRRLGPDHFDDFRKGMINFFEKMKMLTDKGKPQRVIDEISFRERLFNIEREGRDDLAWRKRKLVIPEFWENSEAEWCDKNCLPDKRPFVDLLQCIPCKNAESSAKNEKVNFDFNDYEYVMKHWEGHFLPSSNSQGLHEVRSQSLHFLGLQRWNSTSPALGRSLGGGYLIYHTNANGEVDLGVAIDPGFDFIRNLFKVGFTLTHIDVVLLSHAHMDHVRDFESMLALCLELKKRSKIKHKLHAIMTRGIYRRLEHVIRSSSLREFVEPYILDMEKDIVPDFIQPYLYEIPQTMKFPFSLNGPNFKFILSSDEKKPTSSEVKLKVAGSDEESSGTDLCLTITPTRAYHDDYSEYSDSFGFLINFGYGTTGQPIAKIGYTGDTSWFPDVMQQYDGCDALLIHLGSLIDRENSEKMKFEYYNKVAKCLELVRDKNHPYLMGLLFFLREIRNWSKLPLVLISEFGEELRGEIRRNLMQRLREAYAQEDRKIGVLPVDVGLDVMLACCSTNGQVDKNETWVVEKEAPLVLCVQCQNFVPVEKADFATFGYDEALFCVCTTCKKSTPTDVLQDTLRTLYEVGRPLHI